MAINNLNPLNLTTGNLSSFDTAPKELSISERMDMAEARMYKEIERHSNMIQKHFMFKLSCSLGVMIPNKDIKDMLKVNKLIIDRFTQSEICDIYEHELEDFITYIKDNKEAKETKNVDGFNFNSLNAISGTFDYMLDSYRHQKNVFHNFYELQSKNIITAVATYLHNANLIDAETGLAI